jgi:predicted phosphodiesterase
MTARAVTSAAKRLFRIQYVSDIHLEFYDKLAFPLIVSPTARYLALAGDIGNPQSDLFKSFLDYTSRNWERVFCIAGNHEYYAKHRADKWGKSHPSHMFETQKILKSLCSAYSNVHFLHHDSPAVYIEKENVAVVGATLWTHIPSDCLELARKGMNDFNLIPMPTDDGGLRKLTPEDVNVIHTEERDMLESQIYYWGTQKAQVCVITHHMPSFRCISPRFADSPLNVCFASHCESLMAPHVRAWIYGHTHNVATTILKNTVCVVNARGYPLEKVPGFRNDAWVEFPIEESGGAVEDTDLVAAAAGIKPPLLDEEIEFV